MLFTKHAKPVPDRIDKIEIYRQKQSIDVLIVVNDRFAILIEDKIGTTEHSDQLRRYLRIIEGKDTYSPGNVLPIYLQTGDQGRYQRVEELGFQVVTRPDLLGILKRYQESGGRDSIALDYLEYLAVKESRVRSFRTLPLEKWHRDSWRGYYTELQHSLGDGNWHRVSNPSGGFLGFYWHWKGQPPSCELYLQLEQETLCFKIKTEGGRAERKCARRTWSTHVIKAGQSSDFAIARPKRFGSGKHMTIAVLAGDHRVQQSGGTIDVEETVTRLRLVERLLDQVHCEHGVENPT